MLGDVHVIHDDGLWLVRIDGGEERFRGPMKSDAVRAGGQLARDLRAELYIHDLAGEVVERRPWHRPS